MTERIFEVEISNKTSKGYETATALEMPATWAEFHDALEKACLLYTSQPAMEPISMAIRWAGVTPILSLSLSASSTFRSLSPVSHSEG